MTFNSYSFIFIFLPVFLLGVWGIQRSHSERIGKDTLMKLWLIVMSAFFFVGYGAFSILIFLSSIIWNIVFSFLISKTKKNGQGSGDKKNRAIMALAIAGNVFLLAGFKYFGNGVMPVAISFYTFSQIMFIAEPGTETEGEFRLLNYLSYILFFPKIMQGPIADYKSISTEINGLHEKRINTEDITAGLMLFTLGLAKKVLLADVLGRAVAFGYGMVQTMTALDAILVAVSYSFQLYFDFSGYCDMAEGICKMIGIELTRNFDAPYTAGNIAEFWDRWHISLTKFFTRYLYIPLGGSRQGALRTYINILMVFFVSGLWHGTGWTFVIWGLMHGILMVIHRILAGKVKFKGSRLFTFLYVTAAWVFFRSPNVTDALTLLGKIVNIDAWRGFHINIKFAECFMMDELWYIFKVTPIPRWNKSSYICMWIILAFSALLIFRGKTARKIAGRDADLILGETTCSRSKSWVIPVFYAVIFVWGVLSLGGVSTFLYVNF